MTPSDGPWDARDTHDAVLSSATVGAYDEARLRELVSKPSQRPDAGGDQVRLECDRLLQHRNELLEQIAKLVEQRDAFRAKARKLERNCIELEEELHKVREQRDHLASILPIDSMQRPTMKLIRPIGDPPPAATRRASERPRGGYRLQGDEIPVDDVCVLRPLAGCL